MTDVLYQVRTVYETDTKGAVGSLGALSSAASGASGVLGMLKGAASAALGIGFVAGTTAAAAGLAGLLYGVHALNGELDSTSVGIAGMVSAMGVEGTEGAAGWANAMNFSEGAMEQIRRDAAALPGEASDFIEVFRAGLPGALEAGMRAADVAQFTNRFAAVGIAFRLDAPQIGRDLNLMLQGRAGAHVAMWNRLHSLIGKTAEEFNHLNAVQRQSTIDAALRRYQPMIDAYANTWEAITSTTVSYGKDLLRLATNPFFNVAKKELRSINDWWGRNETRLDEMANGIGHRLVNAYKNASGAAHGLWQEMDAMSASPGARMLMRLGSGVMASAHRMASGAMDYVTAHPAQAAVGAAGAAGLVAGVPGLGILMGGLIQFAQNTDAVNAALAPLPGIGADLYSTLGPLWNVFSGLEALLGVFLVGALPGVMDGLGMLAGGLADFVHTLGPSVGELLQALQPIVQVFGGVIGELAQLMGGVLMVFLRELGSELRTLVHTLASVVRWLTDHMGGSAHGISENVRDVGAHVGGFMSTIGDLMAGRMHGLNDEQRQQRNRENLFSMRERFGLTTEGSLVDPLMQRRPEGETPAGATGGRTPLQNAMHGLTAALERLREPLTRRENAELGAAHALGAARTPGRNAHPVVNVHITQTVNQNEDPERILLLTRRGVMMGINAPLQSPGVRVTH